jgi:hypothetical protein
MNWVSAVAGPARKRLRGGFSKWPRHFSAPIFGGHNPGVWVLAVRWLRWERLIVSDTAQVCSRNSHTATRTPQTQQHLSMCGKHPTQAALFAASSLSSRCAHKPRAAKYSCLHCNISKSGKTREPPPWIDIKKHPARSSRFEGAAPAHPIDLV